MPEERDIFRVGIDEDKAVFAAYAVPKAMSAVEVWDPDNLNEIDSGVNFSELCVRCRERGLRFDGLLFDSSMLRDHPTLWLGYFGSRR